MLGRQRRSIVDVLLHEEVVCPVGCLKDVCNILSRYVQLVFGCGRLSIEVVLLMSIDVEGWMSIVGGITLSIGWLKYVLHQAASARF
ncbi:hypothetical protein F2Q69_00053473 [Brassica cretica]|uniref:Uncharacterized protein n=1 Tax=Brassica cretica TaxID=69181 RepID=A0A8S9N206_BRACR|nr:hypothetical protein F2Q69_00053473 [Brassica cretica]